MHANMYTHKHDQTHDPLQGYALHTLGELRKKGGSRLYVTCLLSSIFSFFVFDLLVTCSVFARLDVAAV